MGLSGSTSAAFRPAIGQDQISELKVSLAGIEYAKKLHIPSGPQRSVRLCIQYALYMNLSERIRSCADNKIEGRPILFWNENGWLSINSREDSILVTNTEYLSALFSASYHASSPSIIRPDVYCQRYIFQKRNTRCKLTPMEIIVTFLIKAE